MEIRALRPEDDRSEFQSGDADLDRFFRQFAGQNQFLHHIGVTYVAQEGGKISGFATVSPGHVEIEDLPSGTRKKLPGYPLPILRLARLAVDRARQKASVGNRLLKFVLEMATKMSEDFGCVGIIVDAKPDAVPFYARLGFLPLTPLEGQSDARPQPIPMFLPLRLVRESLKKEA